MINGFALFGVTFAFSAVAYSMSLIVKSALENIARNPDVEDKIRTLTIIALAMVELIALFVFLLGLLLIFFAK